MTVIEKATTLTTEEEAKRFCFNMFETGKNQVDVEILLDYVESAFTDKVDQWYEEWQFS
jgi:hypothetical protein